MSQCSSMVLMIRPVRFVGNEQTAESNHFQQLTAVQDLSPQQAALNEFNALVARLQQAGIEVLVLDDTPEPHTPDSIFPNNWFSTHADGTVVLYPMQALNRRLERRMDVFERLSARGLRIANWVDLTAHEASNQFLEGTGSMVLDRVNRRAYACLSPRTHPDVLAEFARRLDYELVTFAAFDMAGAPIYHTNVLMCVGTRFAVVCLEAIAAHQRAGVLVSLQQTGHEVIEISAAQMHHFAGNLLELRKLNGECCVAMSQCAYEALTLRQRERLSALAGELLVSPIPTIERLGGGSVRCMLAEIFLPSRTV